MPSFERRDAALPSLVLAAIAGTSTLAIACLLLASVGAVARANEIGRASSEASRLSIGEAAGHAPDLVGRLADRGYAVTDPVVRRGQVYLTHGTDKRGQRVRLVVDVRSTEIIGLRIVEPRRPGRERTAAGSDTPIGR